MKYKYFKLKGGDRYTKFWRVEENGSYSKLFTKEISGPNESWRPQLGSWEPRWEEALDEVNEEEVFEELL